jgi:hypothetical protein
MPANPPPITIAEGVCDFLLALSPYEPEKKDCTSNSGRQAYQKKFTLKKCSIVCISF